MSASLELAAEPARLAEVNATMRAEAASNDPWTRRWRPAWGFISAGAFAFVCGLVGLLMWRAVVTHDPDAMAAVPQLINALVMLFAIPGGILGIASWHRGMEKREALKAGNGG